MIEAATLPPLGDWIFSAACAELRPLPGVVLAMCPDCYQLIAEAAPHICPEWFFADVTKPHRWFAQALATCERCPVLMQCRALADSEEGARGRWGIRGGETPEMRTARRRGDLKAWRAMRERILGRPRRSHRRQVAS